MRIIYALIKSSISNQVRKDKRVSMSEIKVESVKKGSHIVFCRLQNVALTLQQSQGETLLYKSRRSSWFQPAPYGQPLSHIPSVLEGFFPRHAGKGGNLKWELLSHGQALEWVQIFISPQPYSWAGRGDIVSVLACYSYLFQKFCTNIFTYLLISKVLTIWEND